MPTQSKRKHSFGSYTPEVPGSPFTLLKRMPGWEDPAIKDPSGTNESCFLEEAVGKDNLKHLVPFPVPAPIGGNPFDEPSKPAIPNDYKNTLEFNRWILGNELPPKPKPGQSEPLLSTIIRKLAVLARNRNASLYRLRKLHYFQDHPKEAQPPPNPTDKTSNISEAEINWKANIKAVDDFLNTQTIPIKKKGIAGINASFKFLTAELIEVNNYIVSMRLVIEYPIRHKGKELNGSSSHTSLTSPFSSSSP